MDYKKEVEKNKENLFNILRKLVSYNSIDKRGEDGTPFGVDNKNCLERALQIGSSFGLRFKNMDNYCGYLEIGEGEELIGIVCHLDIVPAGDGWNTDPFVLTEKNGFLYGRGTSDDKGAAAASIIALKIINDLNIDLNNTRVRLVLGCNEETGSNCMKYYNEKGEKFTCGFTPDSEFPCVIGEKGLIKCSFKGNNTSIIDIRGGSASNVVCGRCEIKVASASYDKGKLLAYMDENDLSIDIREKNKYDEIVVIGKSAHASLPFLGVNAITHTIIGLSIAGFEDDFVDSYCKIIDVENSGKYLGIDWKDCYCALTMVNGTIEKKDDVIVGSIDIRVPVTISVLEIVKKIESMSYDYIELDVDSYNESLFYKEDSYLVQSLMKAYQKVTRDYDSRPIISGGGTYAKSLKNCIAFGCEFPNNENNIHNANERVSISELLLQVELYINAIIELISNMDKKSFEV